MSLTNLFAHVTLFGEDTIGAGPMMAERIDVPGAIAAAQAVGRPDPGPQWAPTQPQTATFQALQPIDVDAPPYWYAVRSGVGASAKWDITQNVPAAMARLMKNKPVTGSYIEAYRYSYSNPFAKQGSPNQGGIMFCRLTGSPSTGWISDFCQES